MNKLDTTTLLIGDGLILAQITAIYMYNTISTELAMFCITPLLLLQNCYIVLENATLDKIKVRMENFV
jgi:hypothetical protein